MRQKQEEQTDAAKGKVIADYNPYINYEGSEPKVKPNAQEQWEVDPDAEYAKMGISRDGSLHRKMMPLDLY